MQTDERGQQLDVVVDRDELLRPVHELLAVALVRHVEPHHVIGEFREPTLEHHRGQGSDVNRVVDVAQDLTGLEQPPAPFRLRELLFESCRPGERFSGHFPEHLVEPRHVLHERSANRLDDLTEAHPYEPLGRRTGDALRQRSRVAVALRDDRRPVGVDLRLSFLIYELCS